MALMVSNEAANLFLVLAGERFPMANEDQLRALAQGWELAARELNDLDGDMRRDLAATQQGFSGMSADAYDQYVASLTEGDALREVAESMLSSSQFLEKLALDVEYTKYTLIGALIALIAEIAWAIAMAVPSFGASLAWLAARKAMYTILFRTILRKLLAEIAKGAAFNVLSEVAIDAVAQLVQMAEGNRTEWDGDKTSGAAAGGALAGMFGGVVIVGGAGLGKAFGKGAGDGVGDGIGSGAGKGIGDEVGDGAGSGAGKGAGDGVDVPPPGKGAGDDLPSTTSSGDAPKPHGIKDTAQDIATDFVGEAFVEVMTEGTYSAIQGEGFQVGVGGVLSAASSSVGTGLGTAAGFHLGTAFGGPDPAAGGSGDDGGTHSDPGAGQTPITDGGPGSGLGAGPGPVAGPVPANGSGTGPGGAQGSGTGSGSPHAPRGGPQQAAGGQQDAGGQQGDQRSDGGEGATTGRGPLESSTSNAPEPLGGRQEPGGRQGEAIGGATPPGAQSQGGATTGSHDQGLSTDPQQQDGSTTDAPRESTAQGPQQDAASSSTQQGSTPPASQHAPSPSEGQGPAPQGVDGDQGRPASQQTIDQETTGDRDSTVDRDSTTAPAASTATDVTQATDVTVDSAQSTGPSETPDSPTASDAAFETTSDTVSDTTSDAASDAASDTTSDTADDTIAEQSSSDATHADAQQAPTGTAPGSTTPSTTAPAATPTQTPGQASDTTPTTDVDAATEAPVTTDANPDGTQQQDVRDPSAADPDADAVPDARAQQDDAATDADARTDAQGETDADTRTEVDASSAPTDRPDMSSTDSDSDVESDASSVVSDADSDASSVTTVDADDVQSRDAAPTTQSPAWQAAYDRSTPMQLRTESFTPARSDGPGLDIRGEIATVDYVSRDLTVDGEQIRLFEVPVEITADADAMTPERLREVTDDVQAHLDAFVNGRFALGDGHAMHVRIDPTFVTTDAPPSDRVRVTIRPEGDVDQRTWSADPKDAPLLVHEVMHFVGAREGYRGDHHLLRTPTREGVMGDGARDLPRVEDASKDAPPYLTDADVEHIHSTWRDATPQRSDVTRTSHGELPPSTSPAQAPNGSGPSKDTGKGKGKGKAPATPPTPSAAPTQSSAQAPVGGRKRPAPGAATASSAGSSSKRPRTTASSSSARPTSPPTPPPTPGPSKQPATGKSGAGRRPIVADPSQLTPTPRPNPDGTVPPSIYVTSRTVRPTQPDVNAAGRPIAHAQPGALHQLKYGPTKDIAATDVRRIGDFLDGPSAKPPTKPTKLHSKRFFGLPEQQAIVESADAAGDALTQQEHDWTATSNAPDSSRNHVIAAGAGQNVLNRAILDGIRGRDDIAAGETALEQALADGDMDAERDARTIITRGNATIASGIARFQQYQRAIVQEPRASTEQRTDQQVQAERDQGLAQLTRLVDAPDVRDGRYAALDALDPALATTQRPTLDAVQTVADVVSEQLASGARREGAAHLQTLLHSLDVADRRRLAQELTAMSRSDAAATPGPSRPAAPVDRGMRQLHDLVGDTPLSGPKPSRQQMEAAADALRSLLTPDRQSDYRDVLRRSTDSTGNLRVGDSSVNGNVNTGFDVELDHRGEPTPRTRRLFEAHLVAKPDFDEQVFTSVSGSGDRPSSSIQVGPPTRVESPLTPRGTVAPSAEAARIFTEQQAVDDAIRAEGRTPDVFPPPGDESNAPSIAPQDGAGDRDLDEQGDWTRTREGEDALFDASDATSDEDLSDVSDREDDADANGDEVLPDADDLRGDRGRDHGPLPIRDRGHDPGTTDAQDAPRPAPPRTQEGDVTPAPTRRATPRLREPDPSIPPAEDEGWRHARDRTAPWSEPTATPIAKADWEQRLASAPSRTVDLTVADVRTDSSASRLRRFAGFVQYDRARVVVPDGRAVQVYTVRVHLDPADGVSTADVAATRDRARSSVDAIVNRGYRLPSGDQLHLDVQFVDDPAKAHATIEVVAPADAVGDTGAGPDGQDVTSTDQRHWRTDEAGQVLTHELLHSLGLADESVDSRRVFQRGADSAAVHADDGIMGDAVHRRGAMLYPRNLWAIERVADSQHRLPEHDYPANELLQGQPLPLSSIDSPVDLHTQVAHHLDVEPEQVRDALGLSERSTAAETAAAWRGVLDAGTITVDGRTADVRATDVRMPTVTPTAPAATGSTSSTDASTTGTTGTTSDVQPTPRAPVAPGDAFSRTQDVETSTKTSISTTAKVEGQLTVSVGPAPGFPAATFGMGVSSGADLGLKTSQRDTAAPKAGLTPARADVSLSLTTDGRTTSVDVSMRLTMPEVEHIAAGREQRGRPPAGPVPLSSVDLRGIRPRRVTTLVDGSVQPRSQRDVDALTSILTAAGQATAKGDTTTFSVDGDRRPRAAYLGIAESAGKSSRGTAFSTGWSKAVDLSATLGARGRLRSFLRIGGGLTATTSGQIGGSSELKHSSSRSDDDKVAIYSLARTVQVRTGLGSTRSVEVRTTFSVPIADAASRGLWLPEAVRPDTTPMTRPMAEESAFDPSRDSFVSVPPDLSDRIARELGLSSAGKKAVVDRFDGEAGTSSMHDGTTGGTTITWKEGGRTHRVTVTADVELGDARSSSASRTSKQEESLASKRELSMDSKAGQGFTIGSQAIATFTGSSNATGATASSGTNWGTGIAQLSGGHQRTAKNVAQHAMKDTRSASSMGTAGYHPTKTTLKVVHESTKDPNVLQRGLAGSRLLWSGSASDRHRVHGPDVGRTIDVDDVIVRRPELDGATSGITDAHTLVDGAKDGRFRPIDVADLGTYAKVERVHGHEAHAGLLESSLSKRGDLTRGTDEPHRSILGSGNFSSWGARRFDDADADSPVITRSPFTKPGEVTASTVQALGSDAGLRTIANAGLGGRGVSTGDMTLPGRLGDLHGSVEVRQRLGNPSFVTTREDRTLLRGSAEERAVGASKEWSINLGIDGLVRGTVPGGKDNLLAQIGGKLGYTHGRSKDAERSMGTNVERSKVGETAVLRFDAERSYTPTVELRRWRWSKGFANPSYTRYEPGSVDVELPVREAAALLHKHGAEIPAALQQYVPATPPSTTDATTTTSTSDASPPVAPPETGTTEDAADLPGDEGFELDSLSGVDGETDAQTDSDSETDSDSDSDSDAPDPLAPFRDDSDAVVGQSTVSHADLDDMGSDWSSEHVDDRTKQRILAEVRRVLTETSGSGFLRDAIVGPNRVTVALPAGPFTQRTATIVVDVAHRDDPDDPATRQPLQGETLSTERAGGVTRKRSRFHQVLGALDGRMGFFTRADEVANQPGGEAAAQHDWTLFNWRRDRAASEPVSPKIAVTAEHESLEQHHVPVTYTVDVQIHEHVGGALDSLLPRSITKGSHVDLPTMSLDGSLDLLQPEHTPAPIEPTPPLADADEHRLPAVGAWRPVRWDHASLDRLRALVEGQLGTDGAARPGDVYDEMLHTSISNGMLFNALPRIVSGETFGVDELIARRGAFRDLRTDVAISGGIVQPSIRPDTTAPSTTLQHTIDLSTGAARGTKVADDTGMALPFGLSGMTDAGLVFGGLAPSYKISSSRTDEQGADVKTTEKITHTGRSFIVDAHLRLRVSAGTSTIVSGGGPRRSDEIDVPVVLQVWEQQLGALGLEVPPDPAVDAMRDDERRERGEAAAREAEARAARMAAEVQALDAEARVEERRARNEIAAREAAERGARAAAEERERERRRWTERVADDSDSDSEYFTASEGEDDEPQARPAPPRPRTESLPSAATSEPAPRPAPAPLGASEPPASEAPGRPQPHDRGSHDAPPTRAGESGAEEPSIAPAQDATWIPDAPTGGFVPEEEDELEDRIVLPDGTMTGDGSTFDAQAFFDDALSRS